MVSAVLGAHADAQREQWRQRIAASWAGAKLSRSSGEFPTLESLIGGEGEAPATPVAMQSAAVQDHNLRMWQMVIDQQFAATETEH